MRNKFNVGFIMKKLMFFLALPFFAYADMDFNSLMVESGKGEANLEAIEFIEVKINSLTLEIQDYDQNDPVFFRTKGKITQFSNIKKVLYKKVFNK